MGFLLHAKAEPRAGGAFEGFIEVPRKVYDAGALADELTAKKKKK
jgi:hypothetical protein